METKKTRKKNSERMNVRDYITTAIILNFQKN